MTFIMIIDSEEKLLTNIKLYFKKKNFKIKNLNNTSILEHELEKSFPDILIINLLTKEQEEKIKNLNDTTKFKYIPKIFLTIKSLTEDRIEGYNIGCDAYLSKPFDPEELEAIINNLIKQSKLRITWLLSTYIKIKKIKINFLETLINEYTTNVLITKQEKKVLRKLMENKTNIEIAEELNLTKRTVEKHIAKLLNKTNMNTRMDLHRLY